MRGDESSTLTFCRSEPDVCMFRNHLVSMALDHAMRLDMTHGGPVVRHYWSFLSPPASIYYFALGK